MSFRTRYVAVLIIMLCWSRLANAQISVGFDQAEYIVTEADESFEVKVLIDADQETAALESIRSGLFSFGASISFDPTKAKTNSAAAITIAPELNQFGFEANGFKATSPGVAAAKGNINQDVDPLVPYEGSVLMTITLTNLAAPVDSYPLNLDFFRTLGDTEQIYISGIGGTLDNNIEFGSARVRVVPEPTGDSFLVLLVSLMILSASRKRQV